MAKTEKNWTLNSYTDATWTDLVAEPAVIAAIAVSNISARDVTVEIRLEDGGASLATVLAPSVVSSNESFAIDLRSLNVTGTQALQINASAVGAEFVASGVV